ncbi:MAG: sodium:alanine symporter family protein, partial [Oscillospiraceae bacterium]|nr:sodium:alanine symporter family protein [Oscillospiraceae bacterium]
MIDFLNWLNGVLWGLPLIVLMVATGLYFTIRSGCFQFRYFGRIWRHTAGTIFHKNHGPEAREGMISPFQAIMTAVGGTVGFGNIAGVATAVAAGGPGAVFWMWMTAALGMILKQVEVTLGLYYRRRKDNGDTYGGPTYYMEQGLGEKHHWGKLWLIPGIIFALGIFSTFFVTSSTLTASQVVSGALNLGDLHLGGLTVEGIVIVGVFITILTYIITSSGTKGVANTFAKLVPVMSLVYIL